MESLTREQIIRELQNFLPDYMENFDLDAVGIFEEQGQDNRYYLGYTVTKADKTYHVHIPYEKSEDGTLAPISKEWTVETDDPQGEDVRSYSDIESVFDEI